MPKSLSTRAPTFKKGARPPSKGPKSKAVGERNASGYQKRKDRKDKLREGNDNSDLYEYAPQRNRRAQVTLDVDREELVGQDKPSFDDDDAGDSDMETLRKKIAANMAGDLGVVDSEDDEDIDSDEAFEGESDEERFASFKFAEKKTSKRSRPPSKQLQKDVDLDEDMAGPSTSLSRPQEEENDDDEEGEDDEDEDEDDEGEEGGMSLSAMLDGGMDDASSASGDDDDDGEGEDSDEEEDQADVLAPSDNEDADDALDKLDSFIDNLNRKRKANDDPDSSHPSSRKRRVLAERTEAGAENEFAVPGGTQSGKLSLDDLLKPLDKAGKSASLAPLAKSVKLLASSANQPLAAPLHQREQERVDRQAAYEATKQEVQKWAPTMKRIREAEHLSFPLQPAPIAGTSNAELASNLKPTTELESAVDRLLKSAGLREQDLQKTEELEMKNLTLEEVAERRAELRQMRELMFRADAKAKRLSKIKSKAFRKIQKKERAKNALTLDQIEALDPEAAEAERMKLEVARATERATMRHKNTGKWAKAMNARGELDVDQRRELNAQLERGEQLRRKIQGVDEDGEPPEEDMSVDEDEDVAGGAFNELAQLDAEDLGDEDAVPGKKKGTGLLQMKFMRDGDARAQRAVGAMVDDFRAELVGMTADGEDVEEADDAAPTALETVQGNQGRLIFRPLAEQGSKNASFKSTESTEAMQKSNESDASSETLKSSAASANTSPLLAAGAVVGSSANPWLATSSSTTAKLSRRKNEVAISKDSSAASKSKAAFKKQLGRSDEAQAREADDAVVEVSFENVLTVSGDAKQQTSKGKGKAKEVPRTTTATATVDPAFQQSDDEGDDVEDGQGKGVKAFQQRELVALAFAGDNVVEDFAAQKRREIEADAPTEVDTTLPGWGAWGGRGAKRQAPKKHLIKKVAGIDPTKRADAGKAHVIISEKRDKKASRYQVKDLPRPYTSKAQFERSLETPVGPEWNTRMSFQKGTLPRVVKKIGTVINPIEKLF